MSAHINQTDPTTFDRSIRTLAHNEEVAVPDLEIVDPDHPRDALSGEDRDIARLELNLDAPEAICSICTGYLTELDRRGIRWFSGGHLCECLVEGSVICELCIRQLHSAILNSQNPDECPRCHTAWKKDAIRIRRGPIDWQTFFNNWKPYVHRVSIGASCLLGLVVVLFPVYYQDYCGQPSAAYQWLLDFLSKFNKVLLDGIVMALSYFFIYILFMWIVVPLLYGLYRQFAPNRSIVHIAFVLREGSVIIRPN